MKYLMVTGIPFHRSADGAAVVGGLWAEDLRGLCAAAGQVTVAAPEQPKAGSSLNWGPGQVPLLEKDGIRFVGLPYFHGRIDAWRGALTLRRILRREVRLADLIHTSNFFSPYLDLEYAHHFAVKLGKKTVFVVAEDFYDFMNWNLAESGIKGFRRLRSQLLIKKQDRMCRACLSTATVSFLHTPAAVKRYRLSAPQGIAIRQPVHEEQDVIPLTDLNIRLGKSTSDAPLRLVMACRLEPLKGIDHLLRAIHLLKCEATHVVLDVYGAGSQRQRLLGLVSTLGIDDRVTLSDPLAPGPEFRAILQDHELALMPHLTNDFGRAFWDAMAAGLPVIAYRSDAADDTVRDGVDGLLAPNADVEGLAERIRRLHSDRRLLAIMSLAARDRALINTKSYWNQLRYAFIKEAVFG
jgi:glycosyltransferase involved in cell wall biosynthesis